MENIEPEEISKKVAWEIIWLLEIEKIDAKTFDKLKREIERIIDVGYQQCQADLQELGFKLPKNEYE